MEALGPLSLFVSFIHFSMLKSSQVKDTSLVFDLEDEKKRSDGTLDLLSPEERRKVKSKGGDRMKKNETEWKRKEKIKGPV